jgi:hypothetical protein
VNSTDRLVAIIFLGTILASGCGAKQGEQKAISTSVPARQADIDALREQIRVLRRQMSEIRAKSSRYESVPLDPTEKGYGRINTISGFFLVSVRDVRPYLDGYRVSLEIGNPTTARYNGFKLKLTWEMPMPEQGEGESDERYSKRVEEWASKPAKEKEFAFTETLYPGSWNRITLVISPATAEELKQLEITSMQTDQLSLAVSR